MLRFAALWFGLLLTMQSALAWACLPPTPLGGKVELSIDPDSMPAGPYTSDALAPQVSNPAGGIMLQDYWTTKRVPFITARDPDTLVLATKMCSRDQEVETWMRKGRVYLRLTPGGRAIVFDLDEETQHGRLIIALISGGDPISISRATEVLPLYDNADLAGTWKGFSRNKPLIDAQRFTFGVEGFDIYVRLNGVEVLRLEDIHHVASGAMALSAPDGYGFRHTVLRHLPDKALQSDVAQHKLDVRDFGFRDSTAVGSIAAGSATLSLAAPAFRRGDHIIVAVGQEPGKGMRGTIGVGGVWPMRSYVDLVAMARDHSQADGTYGWRKDIGDVYRYSAVQREWIQDANAKKYYTAKAVPRALHARVLAVSDSGRMIQLDRSAVVSVEQAHVYLDVAPIINKLTYLFLNKYGTDLSEFSPPQLEVLLPSGRYALGSPIDIVERANVFIRGAGRTSTSLFSPPGSPSASIWVSGTANTVRDLTLVGNARDNGFGLAWQTALLPYGHSADGMVEFSPETAPAPLSETTIGQGTAYPAGISLRGSDHKVLDVRVVDVFQGAVRASHCQRCWAYDVQCEMTDGLRTYVQWMFQWADSHGGGCVDCSVTSRNLIPGFEAFKSREVEFRRPRGINASMSMNRVDAWTIRDAHLIFKALSQAPDRTFSEYNPIINVNTNIAGNISVENGGTISNPTIIVEDFINSESNGLIGITVNASTPNITIHGGYILGPNWRPPGRIGTPVGVNSEGFNTVVDGLRVVGTTAPSVWPPGNIVVSNGRVLNCVADLVHLGSNALSIGCITNAEATAGGESRP